MHRAQQYLVHKLDLIAHEAHCRPVSVNYYTTSCNKTTVNVLKLLEISQDSLLAKNGSVQVVASVSGYNKLRMGTGVAFEHGEFSLPPLEYQTRAVWIDLSLSIKVEIMTFHSPCMKGG